MDRTQSNYANQLKRLSRDKKRADFILIYYSLALIIYALSVKFYDKLFNENWLSYSSVILSVIVLIYSIVNSRSEYATRIASIQRALNEVKRLKREVGALPDFSGDLHFSSSCGEGQKCQVCSSCDAMKKEACEKLNSLKKEYDVLVSNTEIRDDIDFYHTICQLCKQRGINPYTGLFHNRTAPAPEHADAELKELLGYISEINPNLQRFHIVLLFLQHGFLYLAPFLIFVAGILFNGNIGITFA